MKLVCTIATGNRQLSKFALKSQNKHVKSTIALCRHPKNENDFMLIHFTAQNKVGTKYRLTDNVQSVLTRFVNEGKATIQFKEPTHDLFIKADTIQLKGFLHLLRRALEKKISGNELTLSSMSVTPVSNKNIAPKKLIVKSRSELPMKGFPRTLEFLCINEIRLCKLCIGVLQLQKLRVLDISDNCIEYLPPELNRLPLEDVNIAGNDLGKGTLKQWGWIGGGLIKTLKKLNLSNNKLQYLPEQLVKLQALMTLNLDNNNLTVLPSGVGNLRCLRNLSVARNKITQVPGSMKRLHLDYLDLSNNSFKPISVAAVFPKTLPVCTLKEYAARKVLFARLPYGPDTVPATVVDYLDYAFYCICGRPCFEVHLHHANVLMLESITEQFVNTMAELNYVPMDCYYCSLRCFRKMTYPSMLNV